jgi:hypothetical protein
MSDNNESSKKSRPPWLVNVVVALSILIVIIAVVAFLYGKEVIERPILGLFLLLAWLGALVGLAIPSGPGNQ